jgi:hypothetical protein
VLIVPQMDCRRSIHGSLTLENLDLRRWECKRQPSSRRRGWSRDNANADKPASTPSKTSGNLQPCHSVLSPVTSSAVSEHFCLAQLWLWAAWLCKEPHKLLGCSSPLEASLDSAWLSTSQQHQSCCSNWPTLRSDLPWSVFTMLCGTWAQSPRPGSPMEHLFWETAGHGESHPFYKDSSVSSSSHPASSWSNLPDGSCLSERRNNRGASSPNTTRTGIPPILWSIWRSRRSESLSISRQNSRRTPNGSHSSRQRATASACSSSCVSGSSHSGAATD